MIQASDIRAHMEVLGSDGAHVGTVDHVDADRLKLAKSDQSDHHHHYLPLSSVARVDQHVHLAITAAAALALGAAGVAGATTGGTSTGHGPLPPIANPAVGDGKRRGNYYLPWILLGLALLIALLLFRGCSRHEEAAAPLPATAPAAATAALPVEAVALPNGKSIDLEPQTLNYELQRYLASNEPTPKTFQFDKLNFDSGSATVRPADEANVDALAQILAAYPNAKVKVVGYTDARGGAGGNAQLGQQRADAVVAALVAKGADKARIEASSGGEANPTDTNATAQGQFENRRTELVVLAK